MSHQLWISKFHQSARLSIALSLRKEKFLTEFLIFRNKYILLIGDSVQGGAFKDLVAFLQDGTLMSDE